MKIFTKIIIKLNDKLNFTKWISLSLEPTRNTRNSQATNIDWNIFQIIGEVMKEAERGGEKETANEQESEKDPKAT